MSASKKTKKPASPKPTSATKPSKPKTAPRNAKAATRANPAAKASPTPKPKATPHAATTPTRASAINAAAQVLASAKSPMNCRDLIAEMAKRRLWVSPGGKTPAATLNAAILREIKTRGAAARFRKVGRGLFEATKNVASNA